MGQDNNTATASSLKRGVVLWHCLRAEHHHQLPHLAVSMKPTVKHRLAPAAYGMRDLPKGLNSLNPLMAH